MVKKLKMELDWGKKWLTAVPPPSIYSWLGICRKQAGWNGRDLCVCVSANEKHDMLLTHVSMR